MDILSLIFSGGSLLGTLVVFFYALRSLREARNDTKEGFNKVLVLTTDKAKQDTEFLRLKDECAILRKNNDEKSKEIATERELRHVAELQRNTYLAELAKGGNSQHLSEFVSSANSLLAKAKGGNTNGNKDG